MVSILSRFTRKNKDSGSILPPKDKTQDQVESAFMLKDFLSYATFLKWGFVGLFTLIMYWLATMGPINILGYQIWLMGPYVAANILFYIQLIIFIFVNYLILYLGIKIYRGFTRYIIPIIKASADLPFRLHQKLLE
jgi:hypothetical protein